MNLNFSKYHGAGNDFIVIDNRNGQHSLTNSQIEFLCHRHYGIGADGLMLLENDSTSDFLMRYFNSDGSESTMCGNGGRCITMFANKIGIIGLKTVFRGIDGIHEATIIGKEVNLKMIDINQIETIDDLFFINSGSPHLIKFVADIKDIDVDREGKLLRNTYNIKEGGTNVNFIQLTSSTIKIRTYERGVEAETLACGTGSVASAIAVNQRLNEERNNYLFEAKGGNLSVSFIRNGNNYINVYLKGPTEHVFDGFININSNQRIA